MKKLYLSLIIASQANALTVYAPFYDEYKETPPALMYIPNCQPSITHCRTVKPRIKKKISRTKKRTILSFDDEEEQ